MIELTILDYLNIQLDVPAHMEVPANPPESFVLVEKTGSSNGNRMDHSTIAVQAYAASMAEAVLLNEEVKEAMFNIVSETDISACTLNSDYNFTDTTEKRYRYQSVWDITFY